MPTDSELWIVACDLMRQYGRSAGTVASIWQEEFLETGAEQVSLSWAAVARRIEELQRPVPGPGDVLQ